MKNFSPKDIIALIFKHKYKCLIAFGIVVCASILIAQMLPKSYEARARLLVKYGREYVSRSEVDSDSAVRAPIPPEAIVNSEIQILTSRESIGKVIKDLGPDTVYPGIGKKTSAGMSALDAAVLKFSNALTVKAVTRSNLIEVTFAHEDPQIATKAVRELISVFKGEHVKAYGSNSSAFLEGQLRSYQAKLSEGEGKLQAFKQNSGVFSLDEQKSQLIAQRTTFASSLATDQNRLRELEQKISFIKSPKWTPEIPAESRTQLSTLEQREQELLQKYTETSRAVTTVRNEIKAVRNSIQRYVEDKRKAEISAVETELYPLQAKVEGLRRELNALSSKIAALDYKGKELEELKRQVGLQENHYKTYANKLEESRILDEMDRAQMVNISIVESGSVAPVSDKKKAVILPLGIIGAIVIGVVVAIVLGVISPTMLTPSMAEGRIGLPVMISIPKKG